MVFILYASETVAGGNIRLCTSCTIFCNTNMALTIASSCNKMVGACAFADIVFMYFIKHPKLSLD